MEGEININTQDMNNKDKKYIDMSNDYVFKKIFNTPKYIKAFYEVMFKEKANDVQIVEGTQLVSEDIYGKSPILDCLAIVDGVVFHMEMQNTLTKDFIKRVLYCACALVTRFVRKGSEYGDIGKARVVWILDGSITKEDKIYVDKMENIWKLKQSLVGSELVEIYIIELPKLMKDKFKTYDINDKFNQMVYMIKAKEGDEIMEAIKQMNPMIKEITKKVRRLTEDEMTQIEIWRQEECERAYRSDMACAREEGLEQGIKQGKEQGVKQGVKKATKLIIKNMYENKFDIKQIALAVNLSKKEVMKILK